MKATLQHELDRVQSMTDDQLWTRYGKMNKEEKIAAFLDALVLENRNEKLQIQIKVDHGIQASPVEETDSNTVHHWMVDETGRHMRLFEVVPPMANEEASRIRLTSFLDGWAKEYADDDMRTLTIEGARELWIQSVKVKKKSHGVNWTIVQNSKVDWSEEYGTVRIVE